MVEVAEHGSWACGPGRAPFRLGATVFSSCLPIWE